MKATKSRPTRALQRKTRLKIADNSGARIAEIIGVVNYKGVKKRRDKCGVADIAVAAVKEGTPDMRHKIVYCVIIRQKKEYKRPDGTRIKFEDNAAIVLKDKKGGEPKGTAIKGPVAREAVERFTKIGKIAKMVV